MTKNHVLKECFVKKHSFFDEFVKEEKDNCGKVLLCFQMLRKQNLNKHKNKNKKFFEVVKNDGF